MVTFMLNPISNLFSVILAKITTKYIINIKDFIKMKYTNKKLRFRFSFVFQLCMYAIVKAVKIHFSNDSVRVTVHQ